MVTKEAEPVGSVIDRPCKPSQNFLNQRHRLWPVFFDPIFAQFEHK
jgi:hypothetical protein